MGWTDYLNPIYDAKKLMGVGTAPTQGGVGGAHADQTWALVPIPGTNFSYDPATGQTYQTKDAYGRDLGATAVVKDPNLAQIGAGAQVTQQGFLDQQAEAQRQAAATRAGQTGLAADYASVIQGNAPSVAGIQFAHGLQQIGQQQQSMAAGANGQNAFAARRAAAMNTARAGIDANADAATLRANEINAGRTGLAGLYGQEATADAAANRTATDAALGYGTIAQKAISDREEINAGINKSNSEATAGLVGGLGQAAIKGAA
jgi:hypothetical protein